MAQNKSDSKSNISSYLTEFQAKIKEITSKMQAKLSQAKSIIGLDIGTTSVKLTQMVNIEGELTLIKSALVDIELQPQKTHKETEATEKKSADNAEIDSQTATLAALKKALSGIDTKGAKVISVVNCPKTCARKIIAPHMPKQELTETVRWEAKNYIPFSLDKAILDFEILGEVMDKGVKKLNVAVAASPKETIDSQLSLFAQLGLKISAIIPISLALQNLVTRAKLKPDETVAIVEMGATVTELNIFKNSRLEFSRKLPIAGDDITKSMTGALASDLGRVELSIGEAERIKKECGLPSPEKQEMIEGKISSAQILSLIRPMAEQLANEIERSFDFYREESHGGKVDKIILFGGGAQCKRLAEFLADELGIEVKIGNPLENIKALSGVVAEQEKIAHRLDLAIGAALGQTKGINLLPVELKEETKRLVEKVSLKAIATVAVMLLLLLYVGMRIQYAAYEKKLKAAKLEYRSLAPQMEVLRAKMLTDKFLLNKPYWEDVLKEISNTIPGNIYLSNLSMENDLVNLKGIITQSGQAAEGALSNFMLTLEKGILKNVSLVTMRKRDKDSTASEFEIRCEVD